MNEHEILGRAVELAIKAHKGQTDLRGVPMIKHVLHVMSSMDNVTEMIIASLHDSLEDTDLKLQNLSEIGLTDEMLEAVNILTRSPSTNYFDYIKNVNTNELAKKVKLADLNDNLDKERNLNASEELLIDLASCMLKHRKALNMLESE